MVGPVKSTEQGRDKTQEDYPAAEKSWQTKTGRLVLPYNRSRVVFQSSFTTTFL